MENKLKSGSCGAMENEGIAVDVFGDYINSPRRKKLSLKHLNRWCNDWFGDYSN